MKLCCDCNTSKPFLDFVAKKSCKDGYEPRCRRCRDIRYKKSSPQLLCKKIYLTQVSNSIKRGHPLPTYTLEAFIAWVIQQANFEALYAAWIISGYEKDLAPSADRTDDALPYALSNLTLMTWGDNRAKAARSKLANELWSNHRPVAAYHLDGALHCEYPSVSEALRLLGLSAKSSHGISSVANGVRVKDGKGFLYMPKTYKGFVWKWKT